MHKQNSEETLDIEYQLTRGNTSKRKHKSRLSLLNLVILFSVHSDIEEIVSGVGRINGNADRTHTAIVQTRAGFRSLNPSLAEKTLDLMQLSTKD